LTQGRIAAASFGPPEARNQTASRSVQTFLHGVSSDMAVDMSFPLKLLLRMGGSGPHLIHGTFV